MKCFDLVGLKYGIYIYPKLGEGGDEDKYMLLACLYAATTSIHILKITRHHYIL